MTLDDDLARRIKELAHRQQRSFKEVVNTLLRRGLAAQERVDPDRKFTVMTFKSGFRPGIDPLKLNQLVDELAIDEPERAPAPFLSRGGTPAGPEVA